MDEPRTISLSLSLPHTHTYSRLSISTYISGPSHITLSLCKPQYVMHIFVRVYFCLFRFSLYRLLILKTMHCLLGTFSFCIQADHLL